MMRMRSLFRIHGLAATLLLCAWPTTGPAGDLVQVNRLGAELAAELVRAAVLACRTQGYQVSAVVVDRNGIPQAMLRDVLASRFTLQLAEDKANAVILSGVDSSEFRRTREDIRQEVNHLPGVLMLEGGLPVRAAGGLVGALGVSGAPGGDKDAACARQALEGFQERLEFAE
jgi:uncharacterized protein GlcG (DUF336 family)